MKKYKISEELKPYIRKILIRSFYQCKMTKDADNNLFCITNASSDTFHKIVQRAKCEKMSKETGSFYVTAKEAQNTMLLNCLLEQTGQKSFVVIDDKKRERS